MAEGSPDPSSRGLVQTFDTELNADSVEWCPVEGCQDVLLCGTYQLEEQDKGESTCDEKRPQTRVGQLRVYRLESTEASPRSLSLHHCLDMPGVLDIKWCARACLLLTCGLVNAAGHLQLWQVADTALMTPPKKLTQIDLGLTCLGLSLDWSDSKHDSLQIVTSDSTGSLSVFDVDSDVTKVSSWHAHEYEAWICAYDRWNEDVIYSGGDDGMFKGWDLRVGTTPTFTNKRHSMGVCSIQSNRLQEYKLAVGSYDEELHVWDTRQMKRPLAVCDLGGGIWRVKWDPFEGDTILTATMYNGFHIVDASDTLSIKAHYTSASNLGYGADWCHKAGAARESASDDVTTDTKTSTIATCSFYDHSLQLRSWPT
ncbi:diphthine methyltransferase-like [Haliotis rufescens]|uniref:diphthine methyltransferase-like n=1 Tax=Haliotis rufescens TaxID=6454 RepID=UPI00201F1E7D|nr:diphthine methyltransferase-like [Haliotis rufescens]